jgi:hypothetical protein
MDDMTTEVRDFLALHMIAAVRALVTEEMTAPGRLEAAQIRRARVLLRIARDLKRWTDGEPVEFVDPHGENQRLIAELADRLRGPGVDVQDWMDAEGPEEIAAFRGRAREVLTAPRGILDDRALQPPSACE